MCVIVGCLSRLLKSRWLERGGGSCKYLMPSRLQIWGRNEHLTVMTGQRRTTLGRQKESERQKSIQGRINLENCSLSLCIILFAGQRHNGSIKCAIKCQVVVWARSWLKLEKSLHLILQPECKKELMTDWRVWMDTLERHLITDQILIDKYNRLLEGTQWLAFRKNECTRCDLKIQH